MGACLLHEYGPSSPVAHHMYKAVSRPRDKAYSKLGEGRERMVLNAYLGQINNPQIAFAVKQRSPSSMGAAIFAML